MNVKKNIIEKATILQRKIDERIKKIPELSLQTYLFFMSIVFFITGFTLVFYCFLYNINPNDTSFLSSPIQYLGLGIICLIGFIFKKLTP